MPYTLAMFLLWGASMALVGVAVGWLLRSVGVRVRSRAASKEATERAAAERWREQEAELHAVMRERDRLRTELAELRGRDDDASATMAR